MNDKESNDRYYIKIGSTWCEIHTTSEFSRDHYWMIRKAMVDTTSKFPWDDYLIMISEVDTITVFPHFPGTV